MCVYKVESKNKSLLKTNHCKTHLQYRALAAVSSTYKQSSQVVNLLYRNTMIEDVWTHLIAAAWLPLSFAFRHLWVACLILLIFLPLANLRLSLAKSKHPWCDIFIPELVKEMLGMGYSSRSDQSSVQIGDSLSLCALRTIEPLPALSTSCTDLPSERVWCTKLLRR